MTVLSKLAQRYNSPYFYCRIFQEVKFIFKVRLLSGFEHLAVTFRLNLISHAIHTIPNVGLGGCPNPITFNSGLGEFVEAGVTGLRMQDKPSRILKKKCSRNKFCYTFLVPGAGVEPARPLRATGF